MTATVPAATSTHAPAQSALSFVSEFARKHSEDEVHNYCWILGAGASFSSGIPLATKLVGKWLEEIFKKEAKPDESKKDFLARLDQFAEPFGIFLKDWNPDDAVRHYSDIYDLRFFGDPSEGFRQLENLMANKTPGYGYGILAQFLARTRHRVVLTVNFDNLVADALAIHTDKLPLVCGHESLARYVKLQHPRPLVLKLHRDLLLGPMNRSDELKQLKDAWQPALQDIFGLCNPIVIGYDGNDGTLMDFLENAPTCSGLRWCHLHDKEPHERVKKLVEKHHGRFVPIKGFDELLYLLAEKFDSLAPKEPSYTDIITGMEGRHNKRKAIYIEVFDQLKKKADKPAQKGESEAENQAVRAAIANTVEKAIKKNDSWAWELKSRNEKDPEKRQAIYEEGIKHCPDSPELHNNFAIFLMNIRKDHDGAERLYKRALELDPINANTTGNFASFLMTIRKDHDRAEQHYKLAVGLDPGNALAIGNYAFFLTTVRNDHSRAELLYKRALQLDPNNANNVSNYANFLTSIRKDYEGAEQLYKRALVLDVQHVNNAGSYASFLMTIRKDYEMAERLYKVALELDPINANAAGNYANFLTGIRKDHDGAERLYKRALELDPNKAINTDNYANFLARISKDYEGAERLHKRALELDPNYVNAPCNYAQFLLARHRWLEASVLSQKAWGLLADRQDGLGAEIAFTRWLLARRLKIDGRAALGRLKTILQVGYVRTPWTFDAMLAAALPELPPEERGLAGKLAAAILDEKAVAALEEEPIWRATEAIALDTPWPDDLTEGRK